MGCLIPALVFGFLQWWVAAALCVLLTLFMAYFFRDPERMIPGDPDAVVSPADGKVTRVERVDPANPASPTLVSIFLSVFDVHINRAPLDGTIREITDVAGQFKNAMSDSASLVNEQKIITLESRNVTIVMKQIAGLLARRCVFWKGVGESVTRGERVGLIKFSSRTDVLLPAEIEVTVRPGERVAGGSTVIGRFRR